MVDLKRTELSVRAERAVLVQVRISGGLQGRAADRSSLTPGAPSAAMLNQASLEELRNLARTARARVVGEMTQTRRRADPKYYLGRGKVRELAALCLERSADIVLCDDDLRPVQIKTLEAELGVKVVDRSELIMDIFATHARTRQARLQVELAQLEYALPRLRRMWTHLDRTAGGTLGGGIGVRGPGEKQLEVDRRLARKRIYDLRTDLQKAEDRRRRAVQQRHERFTTVALVGYTNAGKSTLMNALTCSGAGGAAEPPAKTGDRLFQTLDTRTRAWSLPGGAAVMLSDTVGFIRKLPHHLVASFHATLEDVCEADLLLHVVDSASAMAQAQIGAVQEVLTQIGCRQKPALLVLNKIDSLVGTSRRLAVKALVEDLPTAASVSALTGEGIDALAARVEESLGERQVELAVESPPGNGKLLSLLHERATVLERTYSAGRVCLRVRAPQGLAGVVRSLGGTARIASQRHAGACNGAQTAGPCPGDG